MKTMKILLTALALTVILSAQAIDKSKIKVVAMSSKKAMVEVTNDKAEKFKLRIRTVNGEEVFTHRLKKATKDYKSVFNFKNLDDGEYSITLECKDAKVVNRFNINNKSVKVYNNEDQVEPYFGYTDNLLKISYLNFDLEKTNISIYKGYDCIFKKELGDKFTIHSGYDLNKLPAGNYKVIISTDTKEFNFAIKK